MAFNSNKYLEILDFISKNKRNTKIIAVSKNYSLKSILEAVDFGVRLFAENRVQEAIKKFFDLKKKIVNLNLHLTGPLQTNKVKLALSIFDVIQTLDREKLAKELFKHSDLIKDKTFFVQVNVGEEKMKNGIFPSEASNFIDYCKHDLGFKISGLMCIPPNHEDPTSFFLLLKEIAVKNNIYNLSMGMSNDFDKAILNGSTYVRVGTVLFE